MNIFWLVHVEGGLLGSRLKTLGRGHSVAGMGQDLKRQGLKRTWTWTWTWASPGISPRISQLWESDQVS